MLLTNLLVRLDAYGENIDVRAEPRDTLRCLRLLQREQMQSVPPIISSFARIVTPYAVTLLQTQWLQSLHHTVELQQNNVYRVERIACIASAAFFRFKNQATDAVMAWVALLHSLLRELLRWQRAASSAPAAPALPAATNMLSLHTCRCTMLTGSSLRNAGCLWMLSSVRHSFASSLPHRLQRSP